MLDLRASLYNLQWSLVLQDHTETLLRECLPSKASTKVRCPLQKHEACFKSEGPCVPNRLDRFYTMRYYDTPIKHVLELFIEAPEKHYCISGIGQCVRPRHLVHIYQECHVGLVLQFFRL